MHCMTCGASCAFNVYYRAYSCVNKGCKEYRRHWRPYVRWMNTEEPELDDTLCARCGGPQHTRAECPAQQ